MRFEELWRMAGEASGAGGGGADGGGVRAHGLPPRKRGFRRSVDRYEEEGLDGWRWTASNSGLWRRS